MTIDERIQSLEEIIAGLRERREEIEDQLERTDIKPSEFVDFRVQVAAQLSLLDETIRRLKRRIGNLKQFQQLQTKVKELSAGQVAAMKKALDAVQQPTRATAALKDVTSAPRQTVV